MIVVKSEQASIEESKKTKGSGKGPRPSLSFRKLFNSPSPNPSARKPKTKAMSSPKNAPNFGQLGLFGLGSSQKKPVKQKIRDEKDD